MNRHLIEGSWKQVKGNIRLQLGKFCGNPLSIMIGKREVLSGKIQKIYGIAKHKAGKPF
ncbi:MAG: CsbD family protein [Gallionellaceae bacterium]|jgi:uncharacterized protein YjbJ (UPF0337 family)